MSEGDTRIPSRDVVSQVSVLWGRQEGQGTAACSCARFAAQGTGQGALIRQEESKGSVGGRDQDLLSLAQTVCGGPGVHGRGAAAGQGLSPLGSAWH